MDACSVGMACQVPPASILAELDRVICQTLVLQLKPDAICFSMRKAWVYRQAGSYFLFVYGLTAQNLPRSDSSAFDRYTTCRFADGLTVVEMSGRSCQNGTNVERAKTGRDGRGPRTLWGRLGSWR
jgi:hypothetical protein